jgi:hypothetical protein
MDNMKSFFVPLIMLLSFPANAQENTAAINKKVKHDTYKTHSVLATVSFGAIDPYRQGYSLPAGFEKNSTTGFPPVYAKLEYGFWKHTSIAATFGYDAVVYNFNQLYQGFNSETIKRYRTDDLRIFSGGVTAFYHLGQYLGIKRLDPFVGIGASLSNIRYNAFPQGDSLVVKTDHIVAPYFKAGARYYLSNTWNLFGDIGYDKQSIFSIGISCRSYPHKLHNMSQDPGK